VRARSSRRSGRVRSSMITVSYCRGQGLLSWLVSPAALQKKMAGECERGNNLDFFAKRRCVDDSCNSPDN
jgi:hypothetical protein